MTTVFGDYARYYNLLYAGKPYAEEVDFILSCFSRVGCKPATLLDLGCGTGRHALEMAQRGIAVTGVDMSETMLSMGRTTLINSGIEKKITPVLHHGDARTVRLGQVFDAVTSLFHVMSYQNTEMDALAVFETAYQHLKEGGFFLFDFWYGPGVLTDPPLCREKELKNDNTHIVRKARPVLLHNDNIVEVHYTIDMQDTPTQEITTLEEQHNMRYWFLPELRYMARQASLTIEKEGTWLQNSMPYYNTWNAWMLCKK